MTREITSLPVTDNRNGWLEILDPLPPARRLTGQGRTDYAIIGGGFTGLAAARRLGDLRPDADIALIDAGRIGNNAAGRCSGFAIDQAHNIRATNFAGALDAEKEQISINRAGQDFLRRAVEDHGIDCDWEESGKIHGAGTSHGAALLEAYAGNLDLLQADYRWLDAAGMHAVTGTKFYSRGLQTPGTIVMQPAVLVTSLARTMPDNVSVYEESPVTRIDYGTPHKLGIGEGVTSATLEVDTVILANNGFASGFGFYDKHLIPVCTWGSLTRPLAPQERDTLGGQVSWGIIPADPFGTSVRRTVDDRILIRNIYNYTPGLNPDEPTRQWARTLHEQSFRNRFPNLPGVTFEYTWGGALCLSRNGEPVFGELARNVFGAFCLNGVGIARGTAYGKLLAEHVAGETSGLLTIMLKAGRPDKLPPKPFLGWGVNWAFAQRRRKAGLEL